VLNAGWLALAVVATVLLTMWVTFTLTRLDRLHARVDAAQASLDAQLVRRAAALLHVAQSSGTGLSTAAHARFEGIAETALTGAGIGEDGQRQAAENAVGRAVTELVGGVAALQPEAERELREAAARVLIARRFYNDAVRDTRSLRQRRMPRLLHLAGRREMPQFFDIDDTAPAERPASVALANAPAKPAERTPSHG
jgi:hypothetical protein